MPINVTMPALSPTMTEGNLAKWHKKEGDTVNAGDVIAEIETDKATMEVEAVDEGILAKILVPAGTPNVAVNDVIAVLVEEGEDVSSIVIPASGGNTAASSVIPTEGGKAAVAEGSASPKNAQNSSIAEKQSFSSAQNDSGRIFATPLARRIAADKGIDLKAVKGSGPRGRIVKADVEGAKAGATPSAPKTSAAPIVAGQQTTELPNNNIKKITAKRLLESKTTIPHFYLSVDCRLDALLAAREQINKQANGAYKLSVNDFIIKAAAMALKAYPAANVSWTDDAVIQYANADISVAVSTPNGLITPIVRAAEQKGLRAISDAVKDLAGRAREGKLKPEEFQGGTFTVSNLGMFGVSHFSAIINPPQSCILAIGAGEQRPIVDGGQIVIANMMTVTLSVDHRSVDGSVGAEYLQYFKKFIENPVEMLV